MTAGRPADSPGGGQSAQTEAAPGGAGELRQEIERTREQLGETVEQLAAKADLKSRARREMTAVAGHVRSTALRARAVTAGRAESVRGQLAGVTVSAGQRRALMAVAATGSLIAGYLTLRRWRNR